MKEIVPEIRKKNGEWEVDYDKDAPIVIREQPTKKDPNVEVTMGLHLVPVKIRYKEEGQFTEDQVKGGVETLQKEGCKLCSSSEKTLAKFISMVLDKEGVQPMNPSDSIENSDVADKSVFGIRERILVNREKIIGGRGGLLGGVLGRNSQNTEGNEKKKRRVFSLQELREKRPRFLDLFTMEY